MKNFDQVQANYERETIRLWDEQNKREPEVEEQVSNLPDPDTDDYAADLAARDYESRLFQDPKE